MESADVVVIGAGLAGLRCATDLASAGLEVILLESRPVVGGRQATDEVDGFLLDRGFQVLNPAYPAVRRAVEVDALRIQPFPAGVRVVRDDRVARVAHPLRHPSLLVPTLRSGLIGPRDALAFARWAAPAVLRPRRAKRAPDRSLGEAWDAVGLRGPLRREVLEPFLAGVLADDTGATSDVFTRLLVRSFALGRPGIPARGIAALPAQLSATAGRAGARLRLNARVTRVSTPAGAVEVEVAEGDPLRARAVVVAVSPEAVSTLIDIPEPATRGLQTWWFAADDGAPDSALLSVDGRRRGPIVNTVVMSRTAPTYAPRDRHLVEATCLLPRRARDDPSAAPSETAVRAHLAQIWGAQAADWTLLRRDDIPHALPDQRPPKRLTTPARVRRGVYVAGDHRDTASIQGAMASGERVARAVLRDLGTGR